MSRVVRKETLHKYISLGRKSYLETWIPVTSIDWEVSSFKPRQIQLSRSYREAIEETWAFSIDPPSYRKVSSFNLDRSRDVEQLSSYLFAGVELSVELYWTDFLHLFLGPIFMALILGLNNMFLEVLNTS